MEGLLGWTTPFIWTMPGLLLVAFPVPFPAGLPAEGLLVAAFPFKAFLRDMFQDLRSIFMKPASSKQQPKLNDLGRICVRNGLKSCGREEVQFGWFFHLRVGNMFLNSLWSLWEPLPAPDRPANLSTARWEGRSDVAENSTLSAKQSGQKPQSFTYTLETHSKLCTLGFYIWWHQQD